FEYSVLVSVTSARGRAVLVSRQFGPRAWPRTGAARLGLWGGLGCSTSCRARWWHRPRNEMSRSSFLGVVHHRRSRERDKVEVSSTTRKVTRKRHCCVCPYLIRLLAPWR